VLLHADEAPAAALVADPHTICSSSDPAKVPFYDDLASNTKGITVLDESRLPELVLNDKYKEKAMKLVQQEVGNARPSTDDCDSVTVLMQQCRGSAHSTLVTSPRTPQESGMW
jgi:hypothetical protein